MNSQRASNRAGKSLLELLVVMALASVVLTLGAQTLIQLLRAERLETSAVSRSMNLSRVARQFRADVHDAKSAQLIPADDQSLETLELRTSDGRRIVYIAEESEIRRTVHNPPQTAGREAYRLYYGDLHFEVDDKEERASLGYSYLMGRGAENPTVAGKRRVLRIDAYINPHDLSAGGR